MADDIYKGGKDEEEEKRRSEEDTDSGLGNLPPLSEFESSSGGDVESDLPPLRDDSGKSGGLPPLSSIEEEDPTPTGGRVTPRPPGFESPSDFDTPTPPAHGGGSSFQDLTGESDFAPDTPPERGADSDLSTPMFDSAFGGGEGDFTQTPDTSAPTQAMETPMFGSGASSAGGGFDEGTFGGGAQTGGTPAPDFGPDTGVRTPAAPVITAGPQGGGGGGMRLVVGLIIGLLIGAGGLFGAAKAGLTGGLLGDSGDELQQARMRITQLETTVRQYQDAAGAPGGISPEELDRLVERQAQLQSEVQQLEQAIGNVQAELAALEGERSAIEADIAAKSDQFAEVSMQYEELLNQLAITRARRDGLAAEAEHLTGLVGELEDANARRAAVRETFLASLARLETHVRDSMPLTAAKHSRDARLAKVRTLRQQAEQSNWVSPRLMADYAQLYLDELRIAENQEYFFARIPVTDRYGNTDNVYAECVMNGTWSVFFRTLDGNTVGVYENVAREGAPRYEFRTDLPPSMRDMVQGVIAASRPEGFETQVDILAQKQLQLEDKTAFQRVFDSL